MSAPAIFNLENEINSLKQEIGEWVPLIENANVTYEFHLGQYVKQGNLVYVNFTLRGTINSITGPGYAFIKGLPFVGRYPDKAGSLFEADGCFAAGNSLPSIRFSESKIGIQNTSKSLGTTIESWVAGKSKFYLSGSGTYIC